MKKIKILYAILFVFLGVSCSKPTEYEKLETYLKTNYDYVLTDSIKNIVFIRAKGCSGCNKSYSNSVVYYLDSINSLKTIIIVDANPSMLDISPYFTPRENVFLNKNKNLNYTDNFSSSQYIRLKDKHIDTCIVIDGANGLVEKVKFVLEQIIE